MAEQRDSSGGAQGSTDTSEGEARDATEEEQKKKEWMSQTQLATPPVRAICMYIFSV